MKVSHKEKKMLIAALQCELESMRRTMKHSEGMPNFKTYMLARILMGEHLMDKLLLHPHTDET